MLSPISSGCYPPQQDRHVTPLPDQQRSPLTPLFRHHAVLMFAFALQPAVLPAILLSELGSPAFVFLWHVPWTLLMALLVVPVFNRLARHSQLVRGMIIGVLLEVLVLFLLGPAAPGHFWLLFLGSLLNGLQCAFYWMPRHVVVSRLTDTARVGQQVGRFKIIDIITGTVGPVIGGMLAHSWSPAAVLGLAAIITLASTPPLANISTALSAPPRTVPPVRALFSEPPLRAVAITAIGEAITERFFATAWSLVFLLFIGSMLELGAITGIAALVSATTAWFVGHHFDRRRFQALLGYTTLLRVATLFLFPCLVLAPRPDLTLLVTSLAAIAEAAHGTVASGYIFGLSTKLDATHVHAVRELTLNWTRVVTSLGLGLAFLWLPPSALWGVLCVGALSQLGWLALLRVQPIAQR